MKEKVKNRGISLIVLIITIIVIIVLATAVILSVLNNNPIENAKQAKESHNKAVDKEKISLLQQQKLLKQSLNNKTEDEINEEIIKEIYPNLNYEEEIKVSRGSKVYVGEDESIKKELQQGLGILSIKKDILDYVEQIKDKNLIVNDCYLTCFLDKEEYSTVENLLKKLPEGSTVLKGDNNVPSNYSEVEGSTNLGTNFKILDKNGNTMLYTVFFGEINGDGYINITDFALIKRAIEDNAKEQYNLPNQYAMDVNGDKMISLSDTECIITNIKAGIVRGQYYTKIDFVRPVTLGINVE